MHGTIDTDHIVREVADGVQTLRLNRPDKKNAITRPMYAALASGLKAPGEGVRATVLLGSPGAFSAGNDMADFLAYATSGALGTEVLDFLHALARCEHPIVSAVDGLAIGVGATVHLHCDATFATPRSRFAMPFVDLALVPEAASSLLLPRAVGPQRAFAMLGAGHSMSAEEARAAGLILGVAPEDRVEEAALAFARDLAAKPPEALRFARRLSRPDPEEVVRRIDEEAEHFARQLRSAEARAAFEAFMARKKG